MMALVQMNVHRCSKKEEAKEGEKAEEEEEEDQRREENGTRTRSQSLLHLLK